MATITKRNLKARQGKQRWRRNIVVTMEPYGSVDFPQKEAQPVEYTIDSKPINIYENKDRFKKKPIDNTKLSKNEQIKIKNLSQQTKAIIKSETNELQDLWANEGGKKKIRTSDVKAIVTPHPGQSYNPQFKDYNDLLDDVVAKEIKSLEKLKNKETDEQKIQKQIQREKEKQEKIRLGKIHKKQGKEAVDKIIEKKKNHELNLIKKIKKQINESARIRLNKRKQLRKEKKIIEAARHLQGKNLVPIKVGSRLIQATQDEFVGEGDLKSHLRHVSQGELLVRSEFNGFIRRGLIEPKSKSNKLSKAKVPLYKVKEK